jgi:xanthine/uracil/vitamin C permease (AzgA family)
MGLLANLPVGMAPGLGLNAYVCSQLLRRSHHLIGIISAVVL